MKDIPFASANEDLRQMLAEHVANGGTFAAFARAHDATRDKVRAAWNRIVREMGAQAA